MKKTIQTLTFLDTLIVVLNIAAGRGNFLLLGLLHLHSTMVVCFLTIFIDVVYILVRFGGISSNLKFPSGVYYCELLLFYNYFHMMSIGKGSMTSLGYFLLLLSFSIILSQQIAVLRKSNISINEGLRQLSKGYLWISLFSIIGIILSFILLNIHETQGVLVNADYLSAHEENGLEHFWKYFTLSSPNSFVRVPFFQDFGILTGLFHEPHILTLNVFPCLILLLWYADNLLKRSVVIVFAILMMFFSGSTTNILVVGVCLLLYFSLHFKKHFFGIIITVAVIAFGVYFYYQLDDTLFLVVSGRLDVDHNSQQVSRNLLEFAFTPRTLFGSNILETTYAYGEMSNDDVGFIAFFLNICFLIAYGINIIKLLFRKDRLSEVVAFASLYYILHSAKVGLTMYIQTLPILLVFLQYYLLSNGRNSVNRKSVTA